MSAETKNEQLNDNLTVFDWNNTSPVDMQSWTERRLLESQRITRNELFSSWVQSELQRRRNNELKVQIASLEKATDQVHGAVGLLAQSSDKLEGLTKWLIGLTVLLILLTALLAAPIVQDFWRPAAESHTSPAPAAEPAKP